MRTFRFSKLVRDNIVSQIVSSGNNPHWKTLSDNEYKKELIKKLVEEVSELADAEDNEIVAEIADVQEIVDNLLEVLNITKKELIKAQEVKNAKNGSFKKRQYIDTVDVKDGASEIEYYLKNPKKYPEVK